MAATASSSSVDAFFALLEVWEFGQASFLAARLRGRQMRLSAALQQLARCEEQYLSMEFVEQRFLRASFGISNLERRMDGAATELESCLRSIRTRLAHAEPISLPQTPVPTPTRLAPTPTSTARVAGTSDAVSALHARATAPEQPGGLGLLSTMLRAVVTCEWPGWPAASSEAATLHAEGGGRGSPMGTPGGAGTDTSLLLETLEEAIEMVRLRQATVLVY